MNPWTFLAGIMPNLLQLGEMLLKSHGGNVAAANGAIKRMIDHGSEFGEHDKKMRDELEKAKDRDAR